MLTSKEFDLLTRITGGPFSRLLAGRSPVPGGHYRYLT